MTEATPPSTPPSTPPHIFGSQQDRRVRARTKQRDLQFQQRLEYDMKDHENELRNYFKQFKKPVSQDPRAIKRSQSFQRLSFFVQLIKPFTQFYHYFNFWNMKCLTPEEDQVLKLARKNAIKQMVKGSIVGLLITNFITYQIRRNLSSRIYLLNGFVAITSGIMYGSLSSTKFTLEQFEKLGDGYQLGRLAKFQIQKFRMDRKFVGENDDD